MFANREKANALSRGSVALTSLVDVFSVVLFFVVLASAFVGIKSLSFDEGAANKEQKTILLSIKDGAYIFRQPEQEDVTIARTESRESERKALHRALLDAKTRAPNQTSIVIEAAPSVPFARVLNIIDDVKARPSRAFGESAIVLYPDVHLRDLKEAP